MYLSMVYLLFKIIFYLVNLYILIYLKYRVTYPQPVFTESINDTYNESTFFLDFILQPFLSHLTVMNNCFTNWPFLNDLQEIVFSGLFAVASR